LLSILSILSIASTQPSAHRLEGCAAGASGSVSLQHPAAGVATGGSPVESQGHAGRVSLRWGVGLAGAEVVEGGAEVRGEVGGEVEGLVGGGVDDAEAPGV